MSTRDSQLLVAALVWTTIALVCAALALAKPQSHTVYPIYTYAAGEWVAGRDIYVEVPGFDYFRYSPTVAAFLVPWRLLGEAWGGAIWRLAGIGLLTAGLLTWSRHVWYRHRPMEQAGLLFLLITPFLLQNAHNGQSNPHMLGMLLLGTADATRGRPWRSAGWFAAAALFKPYVLAIAALVALIERRLLPRLIIALAVGLGLAFLCQSPDYVAGQYGDWFRHLTGDKRGTLGLRDAYRDVALLFRRYLVPLPPAIYLAGTTTVGLLIALLVWPRKNLQSTRPCREQIGRAFALGSCWVTALGPATESCTYLLVAPALAMALLARPGKSGRWVRVSYSLFIGTITAALFPQDWQIQALGPQPIAGLILLGVLAVEAVEVIRAAPYVESMHFSAAA
jgi:Glycosyltransferase family 87